MGSYVGGERVRGLPARLYIGIVATAGCVRLPAAPGWSGWLTVSMPLLLPADPVVVVSFPVDGDEHGASLVAWTTTPWTLPSNLALCVHPEMDYIKARDPGEVLGC